MLTCVKTYAVNNSLGKSLYQLGMDQLFYLLLSHARSPSRGEFLYYIFIFIILFQKIYYLYQSTDLHTLKISLSRVIGFKKEHILSRTKTGL